MAFLTLNGTAIPVFMDSADVKHVEHRSDRQRMFDGTYRVSRGTTYREISFSTTHLLYADALAVITILKSNTLPLLASGDVVGGDSILVMPLLQSSTPKAVRGGTRWTVVATLYETPGLLPADTSAVPWAFYARGRGMWQDADKLVPAGDGDPIKVWADQSGNGYDAVQDTSEFDSSDLRPVRSGNQVHFGVAAGYPGAGDGRSALLLPRLDTHGFVDAGEILATIRIAADPPGDTIHSALWSFGDEGSETTQYPATTGHILENWGLTGSGAATDIGDPDDDLTGLCLYNVASNTTAWTVRLNGTPLFTMAGAPGFSRGTPYLGVSAGGATKLTGWLQDVVLFNAVLTTAQRRSWSDYLLGLTDDPPLSA